MKNGDNSGTFLEHGSEVHFGGKREDMRKTTNCYPAQI